MCRILKCCTNTRYFENYKNLGEFLDLDLLDNLGDTILVNERLMFLGKTSDSRSAVIFLVCMPSYI